MHLDPMIEAVRQAVILCQRVQGNGTGSSDKYSKDKDDTEPVTIADYGAQAIIARTIAQHFPDDAVIAEEAGAQFRELTSDAEKTRIQGLLADILGVPVDEDTIVQWLDHGKDVTANRTWIIDPIDGTKGFINNRHYAVGVGFAENGQLAGGVMGAPAFGDNGTIFYAQSGQAYQMPLNGGNAETIRVSQQTDVAQMRVVQSFERQHASKSRMADVRARVGLLEANVEEMDSMEKYARVACGAADVYLRLPNLDNKRPHMAWDHAAGAALVLAAGGKATDVDGSPLDFSQGVILPNRGMIVSSGAAHDALIAATQALLADEAAGDA